MQKSSECSFKKKYPLNQDKQACPNCGEPIGICAGTKDAICKNCGFKDPCCE